MPATIGQPLRRKEDLRLLTGGGRFSDDVSLPNQAYAVFVRSPHAHARIRSIAAAAARAMPGVLAVLTAADAEADGIRPIPHTPIPMKPPADIALKNRDGTPHGYAPHPLLAADRVRHVGEQVAMVVAETVMAARDAAERVVVDYEALAPVVAGKVAAAAGATRLYDDVANVCIDADVGDPAGTAAAFVRAAHIVKLDTLVQRVTGVPLDARAAIGAYDAASGRYTLHAGSGGVVRQKRELAAILGVPDAMSCRATSAAISARATPSSPNSASSPGRRSASAARSNGRATAARRSSPTTRAATRRSRPSSHSTPTAASSRCAAPSSATPAPTA
jgi:aerobic carbon-monoxide dehydrogenase large subunit